MGTIVIGFIGGVIGGIVVNMVSYKFQKREEKKEEEERSRIEYKRSIKAKLNEIIEAWNKELTQDPLKKIKIQKEFSNYSNQLTSIVARAPDDFPEDITEEIRELTVKLEELPFLFLNYDEYGNIEYVYRECHKIKEKAEDIREKIE